MDQGTSVVALNQSLLPTMPRVLKRVAEVAAKDPAAVTRMTVEELAAAAECSEGTVIRWCKELGFGGFQDLKLSLAFDSALQELSGVGEQVDNVFGASTVALAQTEQVLSGKALDEAARKINFAASLVIVGVGASSHVAGYLGYRLLRLGLLCECYSDMHLALMAASVLDLNSVLIAVSSSGSTVDACEVASLAAERGVSTVAITKHPRSRLASTVDLVLLAGNGGETPLAGGSAVSIITQVAVIDRLIETILTLEPSRHDAVVTTAESVLKRQY